MKPLLAATLALLLGGCAENTPPAEEVREHFERGLSGQAALFRSIIRRTPCLHRRALVNL
ncbi:MAG: hypothetical protein ABI787_05690 [Spartobacteria bacterium]